MAGVVGRGGVCPGDCLVIFSGAVCQFLFGSCAAAGGDFVEGVVGAPRSLNPLLSDLYPVDRELTSLIFDGLTRYDASGALVSALAESWVVSDDGRSVTFTLRDDLVWHDGEPVTAVDVAFTYGLLQNEAFPVRQPWPSCGVASPLSKPARRPSCLPWRNRSRHFWPKRRGDFAAACVSQRARCPTGRGGF